MHNQLPFINRNYVIELTKTITIEPFNSTQDILFNNVHRHPLNIPKPF